MELIEGKSPFEGAKYALIGSAKVSWSDIDFQWSGDRQNRKIVRSQVENLTKIYESPAGIRRCDRGDRIYCTINRERLNAWCLKENLSLTDDREPIMVLGRAEEIGERFVCQAGQHRMTALYELVKKEYIAMKKQKKGSGLDIPSEVEYIRRHCWWTADIFDFDQIKKWDLEKLRINGTTQVKIDSDQVIWNRLNAFVSYEDEDTTYEEITKHVFKNVGGVIEDVWNGRYRFVVTSLMAYPAYNETFYASSMKILTSQRIIFYWQTYFQNLLCLLRGITAGTPGMLSRSSFELLSGLSIPRTKEEVNKLFGIERDGMNEYVVARNASLLPRLSDEEYMKAAQVLLEATRVPIESWASISSRSNGVGRILNDICIHVCRWINPLSMMEKRHVQGKMSVQSVMADALGGEQDRLVENETDDNWLTRIGPHVVPKSDLAVGLGRILDCVTMGLDELKRKPNSDWLSIRTLETTNQSIYQQRFVILPWARILRTAANVFPNLKHPLVKSIPEAQIQTWARAAPTLVDVVMTALVKDKLVIENPAIDDRALDQLRGFLGKNLDMWEQKVMKGFARSLGSSRYAHCSGPKDIAWIKARFAALASNSGTRSPDHDVKGMDSETNCTETGIFHLEPETPEHSAKRRSPKHKRIGTRAADAQPELKISCEVLEPSIEKEDTEIPCTITETADLECDFLEVGREFSETHSKLKELEEPAGQVDKPADTGDIPTYHDRNVVSEVVAENSLLHSSHLDEKLKKRNLEAGEDRDAGTIKKGRRSPSTKGSSNITSLESDRFKFGSFGEEQPDLNDSDEGSYNPPLIPEVSEELQEPNKIALNRPVPRQPTRRLADHHPKQIRPIKGKTTPSQTIDDYYVRPLGKSNKPGGLRSLKPRNDRRQVKKGDAFGKPGQDL